MIAPDTKIHADLSPFLSAVRASGVLDAAQLDRLAADLPVSVTTASEAAAWLVAEGTLTQFQASRLRAGKADGLVIGQYVVLEPIGRSPAGKVFKARHRAMGRLAAIKVLAAELTRTSADRAAVRDEARAAARLAHPHVVTVWDVNAIGDRQYLVREYVEGEAGDALVQHRGPLPAGVACDVVRQAALGLQHAHEKGVVHGTVNPSNVLIAWEGVRPVVKVTNFGLGRLTGITAGAAPPGASSEPADYRAPWLESGPATAAGDVYGLGATLHFLITGVPPARDPLTGEPDLSAVPPNVAAVIRDMLVPESAESAGTVAARLNALADSGVRPLPVAPRSGLLVPVPPPASPWDEIADATPSALDGLDTPLETLKPKRRRSVARDVAPLVTGLLIFGVISVTMATGAVFVWRMAR